MLTISNLRKSFYDPGRGEVRAVDDLSCSIDTGVTALIGANGAGKSTLLRLIAGLMHADEGAIHIDSSTLQEDPDLRCRIGYLSPTTGIYPRLSCREMLDYAGSFYPLEASQRRDRVEAMIQRFGLDEIIDQECGKLSTGQAQRVNLARVFLPDPDLVILDEPTTGLDVVAAHEVVQTIEAAQRDNRLILYCTHIMTEVVTLAKRVLILDRGQIKFDGPTVDLMEDGDISQAVYTAIGHGSFGGSA